MGSVNPDNLFNVQAQAKRAIGRFLLTQWQFIRHEQVTERPREFNAKKQIILHELVGARLTVFHFYAYYALESDTLHRITGAIDKTAERIKRLNPCPPQQYPRQSLQEKSLPLRVVGE